MSSTVAHAAKAAGKNFVPYVLVCALIGVGLIAYDTRGFTKPPSWFQLRDSTVIYFPTPSKEQ